MIHLAHPADGLPVCATTHPRPVVTNDPAVATCPACLNA